MKKSPLIALFLLLVPTIISGIASLYFQEYRPTLEDTRLRRFTSYEELKSFLKTSPQISPYYDGRMPTTTWGVTLRTKEGGAQAPNVPDYSTTNIQVEGVDESDVMKTDGEYIYLVSENSVVIIKAYPPEEARVLSQIKLNGTLSGVFINGDRLVIFEGEFPIYERQAFDPYPYQAPRAFVKIYDISDRENPASRRNVSLDGYYFNSRMIGDYVYVVINQAANVNEEQVGLPKIYSDDQATEISASDIYYSNVSDYYYAFTTVVAINVQNDEEPKHETILLGGTSVMYVSLNNIFVTFPVFETGDEKTGIHRVRIENGEIKYEATGEVPGYVLNQFSMDEYEGHFRIATTTGHVGWFSGSTSKNNVYVLDMNLDIVGSLEDLAPGEKIYSARFMGNRCYLVTFKKIDPLFVIDLTDPKYPTVLGQLKITGYSDYLHPYDENHLIGIGKETVAAEEGNFAWYQGVKISLFDVSDVSMPKEIAKYEIGDRGTDSPVLSDHKAFLFDKSKNLLVMPVSVAEIDEAKYQGEVPPNAYGDFVWQGAYVFNTSLDQGLTLRGRITHIENDTDFMKSDYFAPSPYFVKRSLYIGNVLYTISDKKIKMNSLENLAEINEVELP